MQNKIDNRYNSNAMHSAFKGKRKLSGYLLQGNTGQNKLNWQDQKNLVATMISLLLLMKREVE
ncbi:MAG: hypothetical protein IPJ81_07975 [Chitinophagaceae bacterium]|nr:hypothetical protein [Chitinophagaceae bacterium]